MDNTILRGIARFRIEWKIPLDNRISFCMTRSLFSNIFYLINFKTFILKLIFDCRLGNLEHPFLKIIVLGSRGGGAEVGGLKFGYGIIKGGGQGTSQPPQAWETEIFFMLHFFHIQWNCPLSIIIIKVNNEFKNLKLESEVSIKLYLHI